MWKRLAHLAGILVAVGVGCAAIWVLWKQAQILDYDLVVAQFGALSITSILLALVCTVGAYLTLSIYDSTAFQYIKRSMHFPRIMLVSFIAYSFSHNLGFGAVTGNSIRYRFFSQWKVPVIDIAKVVVFGGSAYILGLVTIAGLLILVNAEALSLAIGLPISSAYLIGVAAALVGSIYLFWSLLKWPTIRLRGVELPPPPLRIVLIQLGAAAIEWGLAAGALYFLLPVHGGLDYWHFIGLFVIAYIAGMLSQVPGGLGVFEAVLLLLLPQEITRETIVAAVITYRAIYYLLPLLVAALLMTSAEVTIRGRLVTRFAWWRRKQRRQDAKSTEHS
ncbi:MAG TPA: lysylphosphatidylglycerol synthase domain-containing protein [Alphaproteobacteria bacterium]|nr:lysylphosphatidylglycerol synthase domain-containing protein [Alphaproteobacteria bacterium]